MPLTTLLLFFSTAFANTTDPIVCVEKYHKSPIEKIVLEKSASRFYTADFHFKNGKVETFEHLSRTIENRKYTKFSSASLKIKYLRYGISGGRRAQISSPLIKLTPYVWLCKEYTN